ncbi:MAG: 5-formyltetrahydrofolate cyclo-ligase [Lachnospiraceae bacterium]|nr:5-formyltetrahydrofolate cyclo-ligase [Lachnospiraceae bacterium]
MEAKDQIRAAFKGNRDNLSWTQARRLSMEICRNIELHPWFLQADTVCLYYPLGKEVNLLPLAETAWRMGKKTAFPRVTGREMQFFQAKSFAEFKEGSFHVMEPVGNRELYQEDALVLAPGLGFDRQGARIGYGGGYYDRYFAGHPHRYKLGAAYAFQLVETLCLEEHDVRMDGVASETGVMEFLL